MAGPRPEEALPLAGASPLAAARPGASRAASVRACRRVEAGPPEAARPLAAPAGSDDGESSPEAPGSAWSRARLPTALRLLPPAAALAVAATVSVARLGRGTRPRQPERVEGHLSLEGQRSCITEDDVDYWTSRSISQDQHVTSAEACRTRCERRPDCGAWTWGKARHKEGLTDMCFLMELQPGQLPNKTYRSGVTSGLPCDRDWQDVFDLHQVQRWLAMRPQSTDTTARPTKGEQASSSTAAPKKKAPSADPADPHASSTARPCGPVEDETDYWTWTLLGELRGVESAKQCRSQCSLLPTCGAWTWGKVRGVDDLSDICFLKGAVESVDVMRHSAQGVCSGLCGTSQASPPSNGEASLSHISLLVHGSNNEVRPIGSGNASDDLHNSADVSAMLHASASSLQQSSTTSTKGAVRTAASPAASSQSTSAMTSSASTSKASSLTFTTTTATTTRTSGTQTSSTWTVTSVHTQTSSTTTVPPPVAQVTTTIAPIVLPEHTDGGLFCFAVMMPDSEEQSLLVIAFQNNAGIFECDGQTIYSSVEVEVAPDVVTHRVDSDLHCPSGGEFGTALNLEIFLVVWRKVVEDGDFVRYDWTVKVDPDSVFFPSRLREAVKNHPEDGAGPGIYLNNCQFGLHGPIEVFSRAAVKTWMEGSERCLDHFWKMCDGDCNWGEDIFIDQCLWKVLGAKREDEEALLLEDHCAPPDGWRSCEDSWHIAFHPFKNGFEWMQCYQNAKVQR